MPAYKSFTNSCWRFGDLGVLSIETVATNMKSKLLLCLALVLSGNCYAAKTVIEGVNHHVPPEQIATNALSSLRVGMTIGEADQDLQRYTGLRIFTVSSAMRHRYNYVFLLAMDDVTLQFDEHDKLVSWEATKKVQK